MILAILIIRILSTSNIVPTYEFRCDSCNTIIEEFFKMADRPNTITCDCGESARFIISAPALMQKAAFLDGQRKNEFRDEKEAADLLIDSMDLPVEKRGGIQKEISALRRIKR